MRTIKSIFATALLLVITLQVSAQRKYNISESSFEIIGTSNIHDWTMKSTAANGTANLRIVDSKLAEINSLDIILVAESLKSGKSSMDHVAYETLDTKTNNTISYFLKNAEKVNGTTWVLTGIYTIAGVSREYKKQIKITINNDVYKIKYLKINELMQNPNLFQTFQNDIPKMLIRDDFEFSRQAAIIERYFEQAIVILFGI